ncbi:MAG: hypothetical protein GXY34_14105 [Syntrophomonadaceae bacterium]|nr:hypothetical protein [Syntrophomonadaceae bacterium]
MDQKIAVQSIISQINSAKRDIENFPKSGLSKKSMDELDLAYNSLNDVINHCNTCMQSL